MRCSCSISLIAAIASVIMLASCGTISRPDPGEPGPPAPTATKLDAFRFPATDERAFLNWYTAAAAQRTSLRLDGVNALAISSGGANGAYGAGILVGWTKSGARPRFDIVTGVSTGALIAPLAFAGSAWDGRLTAAFHDPKLGAIENRGLGVLLRPSLFGGGVLTQLVNKYVDASLLRAVASEQDKGRRLLVATTDLDTQEPVIWDMGAIAKAAQDPADQGQALQLFRHVLVASASIPGVFPPVLISAGPEQPGVPEMHVDGGVTTPFFLIPEAMALWKPDHSMRPKSLYIIINGQINPSYAITKGAMAPIMLRTLDTLGRAEMRARIVMTQAFAERNGGTLACTVIPDDRSADAFDFSRPNMDRLYDLGFELASTGKAFQAPAEASSRAMGGC